jgi:hypothetical protein
MGYSLSWLAVKGKPAHLVRTELGFRPTGEREEFAEAEISSVETPTGWYIIISNHTGQVASDEVMQKLSSSGCELVTCFVEEHVMMSGATGWKDGRMKWSVDHDCQKGERHLDVQGEPTPEFPAIRDAWFAKTDPEVDYIFEIPVETAKSITGYRHDENIPGLSGDVFEVLERVSEQKASLQESSPEKRSVFRRFFGR